MFGRGRGRGVWLGVSMDVCLCGHQRRGGGRLVTGVVAGETVFYRDCSALAPPPQSRSIHLAWAGGAIVGGGRSSVDMADGALDVEERGGRGWVAS